MTKATSKNYISEKPLKNGYIAPKVFSMSWPWQIMGYAHAFQPYTYSLRARPFSCEGGGAPIAPQAIHRFRNPSLYRLRKLHK